MTGVQTCALPICFPVTICELGYKGASPKVVAEFAQEMRKLFPDTIPSTGFSGGFKLGIGDIVEKIISIGATNLTDKQKAVRDLLQSYFKDTKSIVKPIKKNLTVKNVVKNKNVSDNLSKLAQEAKKYKSAEEFVKAQGQTLYHGTPLNISELKNTRLGENNYGRGGVFLTPDKQEAFTYGGGYLTPDKTNARVLEVYVNPSAKIKEIDGKKLFNNENVRDNQIAPLVRKAEQEGYDGVVIRNTWTTSKTKNLYSRKVELESLRRSKVFSDIEEMVLTDKTIKNGKDYEIKYNNLVKESADATKITNRIKEIEKQISELDQRHIVIFNDNVLKTKSQLEDIWNKANKTNEALKKEESKSDKPNKSGLVKTLEKTAENRGVKLKKEDIPSLASKMKMDDETKKAFKVYTENPQKAIEMAIRGEAPDGVRVGSLYTAVRDTAIIQNDIDTLYRLRSANEAKGAIEAAAEAGRDVKAYDSAIMSDPVKIMRQVDDLKKEIAEKSGVDIKKDVKSAEAEIETFIEKNASTDADLSKLVQKISC